MTNPIQHIFSHLEQQVWCCLVMTFLMEPKSDWKLPSQFNKRVKEATLTSAATHSSHCPYMFCAQTPMPSWRKVSGSLICHRGVPCKRKSFDNWNALMPQECNDRDLMFLFAVYSIGSWPSCSRDVLWIRKPIRWWQKNWLHGFMVSFITDVRIDLELAADSVVQHCCKPCFSELEKAEMSLTFAQGIGSNIKLIHSNIQRPAYRGQYNAGGP